MKDNQLAFPSDRFGELGMTLRDWFAGQAMAGLMQYRQNHHLTLLAEDAYAMADAMLKARNKENEIQESV